MITTRSLKAEGRRPLKAEILLSLVLLKNRRKLAKTCENLAKPRRQFNGSEQEEQQNNNK
jgi:hypothetical protein